jgi:hypothetical protein
MRPYPEEVLRALQSGMVAHFAPELKTTYGQAQFAFAMMLFGIVQRDHDSAAQDLLDANAALRELLHETRDALAEVEGDDAAAARTSLDALPPPAKSIRLSDLRAEYEALRGCVGALAPLVEPAADVDRLRALRPVRGRIFDWLAADVQKRVVPILSG